ncbi:thermonuclease family protein [Bacillus atrophaeus]|nr:thermonuclease family protein [Bacillus atrophaeus]MCY8959986.1 thermonuclease family protein [Bacillus atrophaeus]MCY8963693.1 thermonuclease family protein [Bacillus atrophaeus]MCY9161246.1 thermonuclease family protein [Bacillus atrophaeus]MCY9437223.1 thermonuclease family protein [Bacillus atrophaeus]MEC0648568.1 thermonuclease family protein [Bacillus atrophaeus]
MKKLLLGIGVLSLSFSLAACGSDSASTDKTDSDSSKTTQQEEKATKETKTDQKSKTESQSNDKSVNDNKEESKNTSKKNSSDKKASDNKKLVDVTLNKTVDGDTIKVNYKDEVETVRYLLVDTPETKKPNSCVQPYGEDASERNKELVNSGKLQLEFDEGDRTDKYGRMLAYVYVDGKSVQETLLKEGLARVAYVYEPNTKYIDQFKKDEQEAKSEKLSIWSKNSYVTDKGFNGCVKKASAAKKKTTSNESNKQSSLTQNSDTNKSSSNSSSSSASSRSNTAQASPSTSTEGTESFANCTELRKKYPNGVPSTHAAYQSKMDRDHDNFACER